jgi:hypothetical protein
MPQAAGAAVVAWVGATGATAAVIAGVVELVVIAAINYGLKKLIGEPSQQGPKNYREVTNKGSVEPRQILYGETRTPGTLVYYGGSSTFDNLHPDITYLWFVIVWAAHESEELSDHWLDTRLVPAADIGSDGAVSTAAFQGGGVSRLSIHRHLGDTAQFVDQYLQAAFEEWDATHIGTGLTYSAFRLDRDATVYPSGAPNTFFALGKWRKLYDPRKDSTNGGSGSHRVDDAGTWEWSNNAALAIRDYITGGSIVYSGTPDKRLGVGELDSRIDDPFTIAAANICDETVLIPSGSQARYTCDTQLSCSTVHLDNLRILQSSLAGHVSYTGGKYRIFAGAYISPSVTITGDDVLDKVDVSTHPTGADLYNTVVGTFFDEDREWIQNAYPVITDPTYVSDDGITANKKLDLLATRTNYRCQRMAIQTLRKSRNKTFVQFAGLSPKAMDIGEWETFYVTIPEYGWVAMVFTCLTWKFLPSGLIAIAAQVEDAAAYDDPNDDPITGDYIDPATNAPTDIQVEGPQAPTMLTALSTVNGIEFSWSFPSIGKQIGIVELWEYTASTPFSSASLIYQGYTTSVFITKQDSTQRYYWVRQRTSSGRYSPTEPPTSGVPGKSSSVSAVLTAFAFPGSITKETGAASGTSSSVTVTATAGTGPYTYAWTFASGGSGITIDSPTSASTTFSATGLTSGTTRSGVARCTVTDSAAASVTADVAVTIKWTSVATTFTLTGGSHSPVPAFGYIESVMGSLSSNADGGGYIINALTDNTSGSATLGIKGFLSDPGAGYVYSLTDNTTAVSRLGSAATYSYSGGAASWVWPAHFGFSATDSMTLVITP